MKCFQINLKRRVSILTVLMFVLMTSCIDKYENIAKYQRPDWLSGKLYTQISDQPNMMMFAQMLEDTKYDEVIDKTGTYAAFVPNDSAMGVYLSENGYNSVEDVPLEVKEEIVKFHILQMPWNREQLQSLSSKGWISVDDITNDEPTAFKRATLYKEPNKTYYIERYSDGNNLYEIIVPISNTKRIVYNEVSKHVPLFFDDFLMASDLTGEDYTFYFDRPYESGNIFYANAKVIGEELFAENGFLYEVDDVVELMPNAEEILKAGDYSTFLDIINNYSEFSENVAATNNQEGADEGVAVDKLYNLKYSIPMNIHDEKVGTIELTLEDNIGLLAPTNQAMSDFFNKYFDSGFYGSWDEVPSTLKEIIIKNHIGQKTLYKKDYENGFFNEEGDEITYDISKISEKVYGSNCSFVGVDEVAVPLSFSKVSAPLMLDPLYSTSFAAYTSTDLFSVLKKEQADYSFFMRDDQSFVNDSSLMLEEFFGRYYLYAFDHSQGRFVSVLSSSEYYPFRRSLYGHIGIEPVLNNGATKEFIETIDGRHLHVYKEFGLDLISGGQPAEYGYNSGRDTFITYSPYDSDKYGVTNGQNYNCDGWLKFTQTRLFSILEGSKYIELLDRLGMADEATERTFFDDPSERYTLFFPSDQALNNAKVDTLSDEKLRELVQFHIIRGDFIFTDGKARSDAYRTYNGERLNINPRVDEIQVLDKNGQLYTSVPYSDEANQIATATKNSDEAYYTTNVIVHPVDTVIFPY